MELEVQGFSSYIDMYAMLMIKFTVIIFLLIMCKDGERGCSDVNIDDGFTSLSGRDHW